MYKLSESDGKPRIKLSENLAKLTLPGVKQVRRMFDVNGLFYGADVITLAGAPAQDATVPVIYHPTDPGKSLAIGGLRQEPLLGLVMKEGKRISPPAALSEIADHVCGRLALLPAEYRRFDNPHLYKVGLSEALLRLRDALRAQHNNWDQ